MWDPEKSFTISAKNHHHAHDHNVFEGMSVTGKAHTTIAAGNVVWENETFIPHKGAGKFVAR